MARCNCNPTGAPCLSSDPGNILSYDSGGCLKATIANTTAFGSASLNTDFNLLVPADSTWTNSGLSITLPGAGTYMLSADVSGQSAAEFTVPTPPGAGTATVRIWARLFNGTNSTAVSLSTRLVAGVGANMPGRWANSSAATIHAITTVTGSTVIQLQGERIVTQATGTTATAIATTGFYANNTVLHYQRIA